MAAGEAGKFEFQLFRKDALAAIGEKSKETAELFKKWGLENMRMTTFSYSRHFQVYLKEQFALDFFQSPEVNAHLEVLSSSGKWAPLLMASDIDGVLVEVVPANILNMDFFDRLWTSGIIRESGGIVKCFDKVCDDFLISDELRKLLLQEDWEQSGVFKGEEKRELLFRVFKHLALGGPVNQYEDDIQPYLTATKLMYRELLTVVKDAQTKKLSIASSVLQVNARAKDTTVYPSHTAHEQSFCYLTVDDIKRHVTVWYHTWH